jgi:SAM-dependent methyltransferase
MEPFPEFLSLTAGRDVLDFGCGLGFQAVAMALQGACRVVGVDISEKGLQNGRDVAARSGVADRVTFAERVGEEHYGRFDLVVSLNSMEHFADPAGTLDLMKRALRPGGLLLITFSPPWYAPYGSHMYAFTRVPWVHLLFSERTVMAVRARFRKDGATRYEQVEGGLNRMTLRKFGRLLRNSGCAVKSVHCDGVKGMKLLTKIPLIRELFTSRISCILEKPATELTTASGRPQETVAAC